jgi:hypothetical protein
LEETSSTETTDDGMGEGEKGATCARVAGQTKENVIGNVIALGLILTALLCRM